MKCLPRKSDKAAQKWACDKLNISTQSPSCSLVHHDQGHSKTLRGDISQVSHCWALRTWVTHVSWHNGPLSHWQRREVSKLRGILFLIAARSPLFESFGLNGAVVWAHVSQHGWGEVVINSILPYPATCSWLVSVRCTPQPALPIHPGSSPHSCVTDFRSIASLCIEFLSCVHTEKAARRYLLHSSVWIPYLFPSSWWWHLQSLWHCTENMFSDSFSKCLCSNSNKASDIRHWLVPLPEVL